MRKRPWWIIVLWVLMLCIAVAALAVGAMIGMPWWLRLVLFGMFAGGCVLWIVVDILRRRPKKARGGAAFVNNQAVYDRISRETDEAVRRYTEAVNRRGLLRKSALYERPWLLLLGPPKSGKTSLLRGSGLHFPLKYPSEHDGMSVEGAVQTSWYFANEAVWIDTPGALAEDTGKDEWQALVASLAKARPIKPVDGVAIVVNAEEILSADDRYTKNMAQGLRSRLDEVIAQWGIEFPVYLILNHTDKIPGFNEYFGEQFARAQEQIFGATLSGEQQRLLPRLAFAEEFRLLCKSLTDLRLDKLYKEHNEGNKRLICRFVIHFEGMQEKIGALIAELFKPSSYEGKPLFRGFYCTSCYESTTTEKSPQSGPSGMSATVANHPLNPKKMLAPSGGRNLTSKSETRSLFVLPLFREIMVSDKSLVQTTQKRTRKSLVRHYLLSGTMLATAGLVVGLMSLSYTRSKQPLEKVSRSVGKLQESASSLEEHYYQLETLRKNVALLQGRREKAPVTERAFGFYKGDEVLDQIKHDYFVRLKRAILVPAVKYMEYHIRSGANEYGDLVGEDYDRLYRMLKAYLSISEAVAEQTSVIDTGFLRPVFKEAVTKSLLATVRRSRLPQSLETIVGNNIGLYLYYLKSQQYPFIQENQRLVASARRRLKRLPNAKALYEALANRLTSQAPQISLDEILAREGEGLLNSERTISALYTQEGWDQFVSDALTDASRNPFKIDWVIGLTKDQVPESMLNPDKLRADMRDAYFEDFRTEWLTFLSSVQVEPFGDLERCSRMLQKLVADQSELEVLLGTVSNYTVLKAESGAEAAARKALGTVSKAKKLKKGKKAARMAGKAQKGMPSFSLGRRDPFEQINATFDPLRRFSRSTGGALSGYEGYRDAIATLVENVATIESQGEEAAITVFDGSEEDPLLSSWKFTQQTLNSIPPELADALRGILLAPIAHTGGAATEVLGSALNRRWQNEIVKPYTSRFSGHYPFRGRGEDASFSDVMDFFRPATGTFWGFYERVLSPFVVKSSSGWQVRSPGSLRLVFNPELAGALSGAERIRDIFFKPNGELRSLTITFTPASANTKAVRLEVNGQVKEFKPGGGSAKIRWPLEAPTAGASLKVLADKDFAQGVSYNGQWGLMKLLQSARVNALNRNTISAVWQINIQNMYIVREKFRIQVAGADHPFGDPVFTEFSCPTNLILRGEKSRGLAAGGGPVE